MSARETILDAAAAVMRDRGLANATTKEIARAAGYSEALLYKHFSDKQEIYMGVLRERLSPFDNPAELIGSRDVASNLIEVCVQLMRFYVGSFPMSASMFSSPRLLEAWRDGMTSKGSGPRSPVRAVERYLDGEIELGRVDRTADSAALASLLCGAAFQNAFFACFDGLDAVPGEEELAQRLVVAAGFTGPTAPA
jgi:AcrR family transcriptional regulator